jgi:uridine kinase
MAYQLQDINEGVKTDAKAFLRRCDERYQAQIDTAADTIATRLEESPVALLSGPSGSGKTTTALKIEEELNRRGITTHTVSMDNYFMSMNKDTAPRTESGDIDFESPLYMDMELLSAHFTALERGEEIVVPRFEFARQMRNDALGVPLRLGKNEIAIFEGIHALNDEITGRHPKATGIYISARSDVREGGELRFKGTWMRLVRRCVRDYQFRGTGVGGTLDMWANVRRGEKLYISPFKDRAKVVIDSSLPYEPSVMRNFAKPLFEAVLDEVPAGNPRREELMKLLDAFSRFEPLDPALVAPQSLLREFLGGGTYQY